MSRPPKKDLQPFAEWLHLQNVSRQSIKTYCSITRRILKELPSFSQEAVDLYFAVLAKEDPGRYGNDRSAWSRFVDWAATEGTELPMPQKKRSQVFEDGLPPLPAQVRAAVAQLRSACSPPVPFKAIAQMRWGAVLPYGPHDPKVQVCDPGMAGARFLFPKEVIETLREYAIPSASFPLAKDAPEQWVPLVPLMPGGLAAYPEKALAREVVAEKKGDTRWDLSDFESYLRKVQDVDEKDLDRFCREVKAVLQFLSEQGEQSIDAALPKRDLRLNMWETYVEYCRTRGKDAPPLPKASAAEPRLAVDEDEE